jgi:hypothetical protein
MLFVAAAKYYLKFLGGGWKITNFISPLFYYQFANGIVTMSPSCHMCIPEGIASSQIGLGHLHDYCVVLNSDSGSSVCVVLGDCLGAPHKPCESAVHVDVSSMVVVSVPAQNVWVGITWFLRTRQIRVALGLLLLCDTKRL